MGMSASPDLPGGLDGAFPHRGTPVEGAAASRCAPIAAIVRRGLALNMHLPNEGLAERSGGPRMLDIFKTISLYLAAGVEAAAAIIIGVAAIEATVGALLIFPPRTRTRPPGADAASDEKERVRLRLGRWLAVALEFELAADILRTAIAPTWNEIGQLAAIAVLRTGLNYFLQREIDSAAARERGRNAVAPAGRAIPSPEHGEGGD
jgi:uncharacterized membrane protein